jgi:hypothetical protein
VGSSIFIFVNQCYFCPLNEEQNNKNKNGRTILLSYFCPLNEERITRIKPMFNYGLPL